MKNFRVVLLFAAALVASPALCAENAGGSTLDLGLGLGVPISGLDVGRFGGGAVKPGGDGFAMSAQYLYHLTAAWAAGGEVTYMNFPSIGVSLPGGNAVTNGDFFGVEAVGRYLFTPERTYSAYATGGIGVARLASSVQQGGTTVLDVSSTGLTLFPGVGIKADMTDKLDIAGEARWQLGTVSRAGFGTDMYNILAFFLRVGWRT